MKKPWKAVSVLLTGFLVGVAPPERAEEWMRKGNEAFVGGDYAVALRCYERAESDTADPGLAAFNEAAALYRLERYQEASQHYLWCLEDAEGERRARACYDLANCLVVQAQERHAEFLEKAIAFYEECLRNADADPLLREDASHNRKLAQILLVRAQAARKANSGDKPAPNRGEHPSEDARRDPNRSPGEDEGQPGKEPGNRENPLSKENQSGGKSEKSSQPGKGNLPPIAEEDKPVSLSVEETDAYLREAARRIEKEHLQERRRSVPARSPHIMDW